MSIATEVVRQAAVAVEPLACQRVCGQLKPRPKHASCKQAHRNAVIVHGYPAVPRPPTESSACQNNPRQGAPARQPTYVLSFRETLATTYNKKDSVHRRAPLGRLSTPEQVKARSATSRGHVSVLRSIPAGIETRRSRSWLRVAGRHATGPERDARAAGQPTRRHQSKDVALLGGR